MPMHSQKTKPAPATSSWCVQALFCQVQPGFAHRVGELVVLLDSQSHTHCSETRQEKTQNREGGPASLGHPNATWPDLNFGYLLQ